MPYSLNLTKLHADAVTDLQPGSLLVDYITILQRLPLYLQPGYQFAMRLRRREMRLHSAFYHTLQDTIRQGQAPDCFGKHLHKVRDPQEIEPLLTA